MSQKFENDIKNRLKGYQPEPPIELWSFIDNSLTRRTRSRQMSFLKYAAAFIVLSVAVWSAYVIYDSDSKQSVEFAVSVKNVINDEPELLKSISPSPESPATDLATVPSQEPVSHLDATLSEHSEIEISKTDDHTYQDPEYLNSLQLLAEEIVENPAKLSSVDDIEIISQTSLPRSIAVTNESTEHYVFEETHLYGSDMYLPDGNHWSFGFNVAPQFAFRFNSSNPDELAGAKTIFERNERHLFSYNVGFSAIYKLNKRFEIESGFNFTSMGQSIRNIAVKSNPKSKTLSLFETADNRNPLSVLTSMGEISFDDPTLFFEDMSRVDDVTNRVKENEEVKLKNGYLHKETDRLDQHLEFIEIPVVLRYNFYDDLFKIQLKSGLSVNYLINNKVVLYRDDMKNSIGKTNLIREWNLCFTGGAALIYPLSNNINIHFEPTANIFLSSMTHGREYNVYPYGISVFTGVSMNL